MALQSNPLFSSAVGKGGEIRMKAEHNKPGTLAAVSGAPLLPKGCPLAWNDSSSFWVPYTQPSATVASFTITNSSATATDGGTFEILIDGLGSIHQWDTDAATAQAGINAVLADAGKSYTVSVVNSLADMGVDLNVMTVTFSEGANSPSVGLDGGGLLDAAVPEPENYVLAIVAAGTDLNGADVIRGFLQDVDGRQSSATEEVQIVVMTEGQIHRDDVNTAAMRAVLPGAPSEGELDAALRDQGLRALSLHIQGLSAVS